MVFLLVYVLSVVLGIVLTIFLEKIDGNSVYMQDIIDKWPLILIPGLNTLSVVMVVIILLFSAIIVYFKIDELWDKFKGIKIIK